MENIEIFKPLIVQAGLMILTAFWLVWARVGSVARGKVDMKDVAKTGWQGWIKNAGDNYSNQYEMPILFFVVCFVLFLTSSVSPLLIKLAWAFVAFRILHAAVHLTFNHILLRFFLFFSGGLILTAMFLLTAQAVF